MREVEVKIEIDDADRVTKMLEAKGCKFGEPIEQHDVVYIPNEQPTVPCPAGTNVLRIRRQGGKSIFALKRSDEYNHLSKLELEFEIGDGGQMDQVIKLLGYKIIADTTKIRRTCNIDGYEICVDSVRGLGEYLEIEKLTTEDPKAVQQEMLEYLSQLGIDISRQVHVGYDVLYVRKHDGKN